jgi:hypothetical protein
MNICGGACIYCGAPAGQTHACPGAQPRCPRCGGWPFHTGHICTFDLIWQSHKAGTCSHEGCARRATHGYTTAGMTVWPPPMVQWCHEHAPVGTMKWIEEP